VSGRAVAGAGLNIAPDDPQDAGFDVHDRAVAVEIAEAAYDRV
jgi:hypothetical protein